MRPIRLLAPALLLAGCLATGAASAQALSEEEIRLLCDTAAGAETLPPAGYEGTGLTADIGVSESYDDCVARLVDRTVKPETAGRAIPDFRGTISYTTGNPPVFLDFLEENAGEVVFLDLQLDFAFVRPDHHAVREACNPEADIWNRGLAGEAIALPLGEPDAAPERLRCAETRFAFTGHDFDLTSGGPGTHWFEIEGFFRILPEPALTRLEWVEADADMWSAITD